MLASVIFIQVLLRNTPQKSLMIFALAASLALHLVGILVFIEQKTIQEFENSRLLEVSLLPQGNRQDRVAEKLSPSKPEQPSRMSLPLASSFDQPHLLPSKASRQLAFSNDQLDSPLVFLNEPVIEPLYGFADDAVGRVELTLLIDGSGHVMWVRAGMTPLDRSTVAFLEDAFRLVKFSSPQVAGKPVTTIFRLEVQIGG